jgi:hypothetical protein
MGVYYYIENITTEERVCLGKTGGVSIDLFLEYFHEKKWSYTDKFMTYNDIEQDNEIYIKFKNNEWIFYVPSKEGYILDRYTEKLN